MKSRGRGNEPGLGERDCGPLTITKQHDSRTQPPPHDSSDGEDPFFQMIYVGEYTRKVCIL